MFGRKSSRPVIRHWKVAVPGHIPKERKSTFGKGGTRNERGVCKANRGCLTNMPLRETNGWETLKRMRLGEKDREWTRESTGKEPQWDRTLAFDRINRVISKKKVLR